MINIFQPSIKKDSIKLLQDVFDSNWLGRGDLVQDFEKKVTAFLGIPHENFHTISSCSDAIFACIRVFSFPKNSKIIIPTNSFPAIPSAIIEAGHEPVIIDLDLSTGNISLDALIKAKKKYKDIKAIFITDYGGIPNDIKKIKDLMNSDCKILVDAAGSLGTFIENKFSGYGADFVCRSYK